LNEVTLLPIEPFVEMRIAVGMPQISEVWLSSGRAVDAQIFMKDGKLFITLMEKRGE
jgi:hypothetical protein